MEGEEEPKEENVDDTPGAQTPEVEPEPVEVESPPVEETVAPEPEPEPEPVRVLDTVSASQKETILPSDNDSTPNIKEILKSVSTVLENNEGKEKIVNRKVTINESNEVTAAGSSRFAAFASFPCTAILGKRSPFTQNPPQPEERRARIQNPRSPKDYIINLREDLADFQESHGLPRTRDYSFLSLGLALAQETVRALCSLFLMFAELFPIIAIVSLILRFALDKIIEILETPEPVPKLKKTVVFGLQMLVILVPLWILIGTIIIPMIAVVLSIFKRVLRVKGGKKKITPPKPKPKTPKTDCNFALF